MATPYIGNNDFRGYLNYLGQNGDPQAAYALQYTGNNGKIDNGNLLQYISGPGGSADDAQAQNAARDYVAKAYQGFQEQNGGRLGAATVASSGAAPVDTSSYDQGIQNTQAAIGRLGDQLNSGNGAIDTSYTNALNQLLLGKNQSQATYNSNKQSSAQGYVAAKNTIGANAGNSLSGLERLLGSKGAGGSSAATIAAPDAVTRAATLQRNDATNTFGQNQQSLDTNWNNYLTGYNNSVSGAGAQRDQQKQQEQQTIEGNRASLLQSLGTLFGQKAAATGGNGTAAAQPYLDQANGILGSIAAAPAPAPVSYNTAAYTAPSLASYTTSPTAAPTAGSQAPGSDYTSPFLAALLGKQKQTAFA